MTYRDVLIEVIEENPQITWGELSDRFGGRSRDTLRGTLVRNHRLDLVKRVDRESLFSSAEPYSRTLVEVIERNKGLTWEHLSAMFGGRSPEALKGTLYYVGRRDLIRKVVK